ncbi:MULTISPECIES: BaiN/RdsA family NAD(P)/FAD-dependent oxidoreductase [Hydrogenophaga]|uniref:Putative flavoprotein n=1 Tax=Hydrogenophaga intermedia TaxID=65786 RepID=A0A1L1PAP8_HYDIT|nr:NAD(FAD)-utilizing dehydrogenase [Hydrogenophaga sp. PBC]TMU73195.1 TIGR03862 family flavoprotein [Hydrogenophaga intermedia]CDN87058.1 Putative flavoprotein [Hydrogenophaga intermedia]
MESVNPQAPPLRGSLPPEGADPAWGGPAPDRIRAGARVAIVGGGPAGLMAAEVLSRAGVPVDLYDAMPSVGRKLLLAGKGGLNLTHAEPFEAFVSRFGDRAGVLRPMLERFGPQQLRDWAEGLGIATFVGSSRRVFPTDMKAAPLLRAWLHRLRHPEPGGEPVRFHMRHRWLGFGDGGALRFATPDGERVVQASVVLLALGGASWPRLGSDGAWVPCLRDAGLDVAELQAANCGFDVAGSSVHGVAEGWSAVFTERWAGQPFKTVALALDGPPDARHWQRGEFVATATGIEGSLVYALSAALRDRIARDGSTTLWIDLLPDRTPERVQADVSHPRGSRSLSSHLKGRLGLDGIKPALLHECLDREAMHDTARLAAAIKALPLKLIRPRPVAEAISSAGGVRLEALDDGLMARERPGLFVAGEMLDWEAPTGGYLLTASMASGVWAGEAALRHLRAAA